MAEKGKSVAKNSRTFSGNVIRVETVLTKYPIHRLSPSDKGGVIIRDEEGKKIWQVTNRPGKLAYKLDTLVINRKIEEAGKPVPELLRLGSMREIGAQLGLGGDTNSVKEAIMESAFTVIFANIPYLSVEGTSERFENHHPRCQNVYFVGDQLPDGTAANSVYLVFHQDYLKLLNESYTRPLDYEYLKELNPVSQRLYEILSFKIYSAIKYKYEHAKLKYSDFCLHAPQTRYTDYDPFKKQMYKVHQRHLASKYIETVKFELIPGEKKDWWMIYQPGERAREEFQKSQSYHLQEDLATATTTSNAGPAAARHNRAAAKAGEVERKAPPNPTAAAEANAAKLSLIKKLEDFGVERKQAILLVEERRSVVELQLDALPYRDWSRKDNFAGYLVAAITGDYKPDAGYFQAKAKNMLPKENSGNATAETTTIILSAGELAKLTVFCPDCYGAGHQIINGKGAKPCAHPDLNEKLVAAVETGEIERELVERFEFYLASKTPKSEN